MGQYKDAFAGFDRAVELAPDYPFALTHRGEAYRQRGNFKEALTDFNRALDLEPNFTWAWVLRGEANRQMGKANAAINDFRRAIELEPENPWPIGLRGLAYRESGQMDLALADYDQAIKLKPDYTWAITLRAETYRQLGKFKEALIDFDRALQIEPENFWPRTLRGEAHRQMGKIQAALDDMNLALKYEPDNAWVLCFRSQVYRDMGEDEQALADCNRALEIQPDYAWAMAHRGESYRKMGKFDEALAELSLALEREPNKGWTLARLGMVYHQLGRYQESLHDFTRANLDLDDSWASEQRQKLYNLFEFRHGAWRAAYKDRVLSIYYEEGERESQYAALHLNDSYFRMVYGPDSGWGTSVILLPVYWSRGTQYQGGQVDVELHVDENNLILDIEGIVGVLRVTCQLSIQPPGKDSLIAHVRVQSSGEIVLDDRPMEAFKPVMLSSMHISSQKWDALVAYVGRHPHEIPESGWIIEPSGSSERFGLRGGTSAWKKNAPTIIIEMNRPLQITGWVTSSEDPNDDNVALWATNKELLTSWEYTIRALRA
jgi:tetratricopeptide (TPR) repeat protein